MPRTATRWDDLRPSKELLDPIEIAGRDEIAALQFARLKWSLRHAYQNVPHYRRAFDAAGVHPEDLRDLADLGKFPLTAKEDLRANYPFGMFAVPREKIARLHASSGTTGKPTVVGYTARDISTWSDLMAAVDPCRRRPRRACGCMSPTATASSPAGSARITAPSASAAPSSRFPAA